MGLRPTNNDEKHAGGECRANMAGLRACFSGESTWAYGPPITMKNTPAANAGRIWRGSGRVFQGSG